MQCPCCGREGYEPPKGRAKQQSQIPANFTLTPERALYATRLRVDPLREFTEFRDYYRAKGTRWKDWDLVWQRWCRQAAARAGDTGRAVAPVSRTIARTDVAAMAAVARQKVPSLWTDADIEVMAQDGEYLLENDWGRVKRINEKRRKLVEQRARTVAAALQDLRDGATTNSAIR